LNRRNFFKNSLATSAVISVNPLHPLFADSIIEKSTPKISSVELFRLTGKFETIQKPYQWQAQPLHVYPENQPEPYQPIENPKKTDRNYGANYLRITTDDGLYGDYGPVDSEAAVVVDRQLKGFIMGQNPLAIEKLWDKMYRLNRHARAGHFMMGISAVDNALWDLKGKYYQAPVYQLLGGPTRTAAQVYGSTLGNSIEEESMRNYARELKEKGFMHQKWFLAYGPGNGTEGLKKNIEMVEILRDAVGFEVELMFDAFMGWDYNYAIQWARAVEHLRPRWIEEAFAPNKIESFAALSRETTIPVATGEHIYNRWEVLDLLKADAISVVQADPEWCGGVSELTKICHIASAFDAHVIPHGHNLHAALHVVGSQSPMTCPLVEYLIGKMEYYYYFEKMQLKPENGQITLPEAPGFGIAFDESKIEDKKMLSWS